MGAEVKRETCPVCGRKIRLTRISRIWWHYPPRADQVCASPEDDDVHLSSLEHCDGTGQMSVERATALARMEGQLHEAREREKWSDSGS